MHIPRFVLVIAPVSLVVSAMAYFVAAQWGVVPALPDASFPECDGDFRFTHPLVDPEDILSLSFNVGSRGHIAPHDHMVYWGTEKIQGDIFYSKRVPLNAPADIFRVKISKVSMLYPNGKRFIEWSGSFYACDGHIIGMGHLDEPSDELLDVLAQGDPDCSPRDFEPGTACIWRFPAFIPAGMPLFKSSGYAAGFDFGLSLVGLTAEELQEQPGYGYSIVPWRVKAGNSVCPLEYFPEPFRSQYTKKLGVYKCGPFNQDVPGTAMGLWLTTPSPDKAPGGRRKRLAADNEVIWLFEISSTPSRHRMTVGDTISGMEYGQFSYTYRDSGLVNRRWDSVVPGEVYCVELNRQINFALFGQTIESVLILKLSEDARQLTLEAPDQEGCGNTPSFRGGQRTSYR